VVKASNSPGIFACPCVPVCVLYHSSGITSRDSRQGEHTSLCHNGTLLAAPPAISPTALPPVLPCPDVPASRLCDVTFSPFLPHSIHQDMPPRPFPYALNIGTDIVHVPRIRAIIAQGEGVVRKDSIHRFLRRLLTAREQRLFWRNRLGNNLVLDAHLEDTAKWLAGRYERRSYATVVSRELLARSPRKHSPSLPILTPNVHLWELQ